MKSWTGRKKVTNTVPNGIAPLVTVVTVLCAFVCSHRRLREGNEIETVIRKFDVAAISETACLPTAVEISSRLQNTRKEREEERSGFY